MGLLVIYASACCSIIENKMQSNAVSRRGWSRTRAVISDFLVNRFVKDMKVTIDELVSNRASSMNKSDNLHVSGYLASQMIRKESSEGKENKKKWRGKINNMLHRKDGALNRSELFMRKLAPTVDLVTENDPNPLVIFINKKSGGQIGSTLLERLKPSFPSAQVCDLSKNSASDYLRLYSSCKNLRVLICGGDGTVGWIMDEMKKVNPTHNCSFGVIPLGTGNDLCIQLRYIKKYMSRSNTDEIQDSSISASQYQQRTDECTSEESVRDSRISDGIYKFEQRAITNLLPNMVISNPKLLQECYRNPKMVQLDRWSIKMERVHGRKRKLLKLFLIENKVKRRGNIIISKLIELVTKIWKFFSNLKNKLDATFFKKIKKSNINLDSNIPVDNINMVNPSEGQIEKTSSYDRNGQNSDILSYSNNLTSAINSSVDLKANQNIDMNQNININININTKKKKKEKDFKRKSAIMDFTMNNYLGVGVDGAVTLGFHTLRQRVPALFFSRWVNKIWYGMIGLRTLLLGWSRDLSQCCQLVCDGKVIKIPPGTQSIILLNINSYAGGMKMWPDASSFENQGDVMMQ